MVVRMAVNNNNAENKASAFGIDLLSNGFKIRGNDAGINANGNDYLFMAFGQTLVGTNNVPATAR